MITTFYSYKGGVGRTQLVANLAAYLCYYEYKKVLLIDWDLEAPGLHYYFGKTHQDIQKEGLIEVLQQYVNFRRKGKIADENNTIPIFTKENNVINLDKSANESLGGAIDLIPAGKYADIEAYKWKTIDFNWYEFYELLDGKRYLELVKTELEKLGYDYIFIDSRTGLTDYSDICNIQMPKVNVLVIAPTEQNMDGALSMANNIINSPYVKDGSYREGIILPLLSRVEVDSNDFPPFFEKFQNSFAFLVNKIDELYPKWEKTQSNYFNETLLSYNRFIAIGEQLLFQKENGLKPFLGMAKQYENILKYLKFAWSGNVRELPNSMFEKPILLKITLDSPYSNESFARINKNMQNLLIVPQYKDRLEVLTYTNSPSFINKISQQKIFLAHLFHEGKSDTMARLEVLLEVLQAQIQYFIIYSSKEINLSKFVSSIILVCDDKATPMDISFFNNFYTFVLSGKTIEYSFETAQKMQIVSFGETIKMRYKLFQNLDIRGI